METSPHRSTQAPRPADVALDEYGFLLDPASWTPQVAESLAVRFGLGPLDAARWQVIGFLRQRYLQRGAAPAMRTVCKRTGASRQAIRALFGDCPTLLKIAGLPDPGEEARAYFP